MKQHFRKIYLASKSPRRRELLRQVGIEFELLLNDVEVNEDILPGEIPHDYVARVTRDKAESARQTMALRQLPARPVLAADTTVVVDTAILGKPADMHDAIGMMRLLSGRTHQVLTSVAVAYQDRLWQITQSSDVAFAPLSEEAIIAYCDTPEPYDKAGGYGIQGPAAVFITHIAGSYSGIAGLPLYETIQLLQKAGAHNP
ncbi:septum formation inhibitor Maf [Oxalobacteraceae bacterium CAVE-383]|nr:septum formation inhibitor Maf [Oxalobacteraceae bacterium CAVE-383]